LWTEEDPRSSEILVLDRAGLDLNKPQIIAGMNDQRVPVMDIPGFTHLSTVARFICCRCLLEMGYKAARFHRLHCKHPGVTKSAAPVGQPGIAETRGR
jgi:hypothetical protein